MNCNDLHIWFPIPIFLILCHTVVSQFYPEWPFVLPLSCYQLHIPWGKFLWFLNNVVYEILQQQKPFFFVSSSHVCMHIYTHTHTHKTHKSFNDPLFFSANIYFTFKFKLFIEHYIIKQSSFSCIVNTFFYTFFL